MKIDLDVNKNIFNENINKEDWDKVLMDLTKGNLQKYSTEYIEQHFMDDRNKITYLPDGYWFSMEQIFIAHKRRPMVLHATQLMR